MAGFLVDNNHLSAAIARVSTVQVDMMLAALARLMNLTVLTSDRDFEALPDVRIENWLA